jgi:5-hydroxyisourate hydrolase
MSAITTHVLDTARGRPAAGIAVRLEMREGETWRQAGAGITDADGRLRSLTTDSSASASGRYRLIFETAAYFESRGVDAFYPRVIVEFIADGESHYHVPLLLSPFGYSTYRGT